MTRRWLFASLLTLGWTCTAATAAEFSFPRRNRVYEVTEVTAAPTEWGPFRVYLRARDAQVTLLSHRLHLTPLADGSHRARLVTRTEGRGTLLARVEALGLGTEQSDPVSAPLQDQDLAGRVSVRREEDRYRITVIELPRQVTVQVRSGVGERLVSWCEGMPLLSTLGGDCAGLRRAVSSVAVPMPRPGEIYDVPRSDLAPEEQEALDAYLAAAERSR